MTEFCQKFCYELPFGSQSSWRPFIILLLSWGITYFLAQGSFSAVPRVATRGKFARRYFATLVSSSSNTLLIFCFIQTDSWWDRQASPRQAAGLAALCRLSCYCCTSGTGTGTGNLRPGSVTVEESKLRTRLWGSGLHAAKKLSLAVSSGGLRHVSADDFVDCRKRDDIVVVSDESPR